MKEEDPDEQDSYAAGGGGAVGRGFSPSDLEEEDAPPAAPPGPPKAVPIGRPISDAEYTRGKQRARDDDRPSGGRYAQEDPSPRKPDG